MSRPLRFVVAALAALAPISAAPASAQSPPRPSVSVQACATGTAAEERYAVFVGRMRTMQGAAQLQMRFVLQARGAAGPGVAGGRGWRAVPGQGLGSWMTSVAGVRGYVFAKRVERLAAPGDYRAGVTFRWLRADGSVLARARARSATCREPDLRPDVRPVALRVERVAPLVARYRVGVRNTGRGTAGPVTVTVAIDDVALPAVTVPAVVGRATQTVDIAGAPCLPGSTVVVRVALPNPALESDARDDELRRSCPLS